MFICVFLCSPLVGYVKNIYIYLCAPWLIIPYFDLSDMEDVFDSLTTVSGSSPLWMLFLFCILMDVMSRRNIYVNSNSLYVSGFSWNALLSLIGLAFLNVCNTLAKHNLQWCLEASLMCSVTTCGLYKCFRYIGVSIYPNYDKMAQYEKMNMYIRKKRKTTNDYHRANATPNAKLIPSEYCSRQVCGCPPTVFQQKSNAVDPAGCLNNKEKGWTKKEWIKLSSCWKY